MSKNRKEEKRTIPVAVGMKKSTVIKIERLQDVLSANVRNPLKTTIIS